MKLDITRRTDLAVRTLLALDRAGSKMKASGLAARISSTATFMPQVLAPLVHQRWVRSDPGPTGGYELMVDLATISVLDVIEAVEGPTDMETCVLDGAHCDLEGGLCDEVGHCAIHEAWSRARSQLLTDLTETSLRQISQTQMRSLSYPTQS